jgi:hypothetical protein
VQKTDYLTEIQNSRIAMLLSRKYRYLSGVFKPTRSARLVGSLSKTEKSTAVTECMHLWADLITDSSSFPTLDHHGSRRGRRIRSRNRILGFRIILRRATVVLAPNCAAGKRTNNRRAHILQLHSRCVCVLLRIGAKP